MREILKSRYGGSWDGESPEIHGLVEVGTKKFKVELLWVAATEKWQCCVFEAGECVAIESGDAEVEVVARALAAAMK